MQHFQDIEYTVQSRVAIITLNRPDALNAWTPAMESSVQQAVGLAVADQAVRVIVITGAGLGFCAGSEVSGVSELAADVWSEDILQASGKSDVSTGVFPGPSLESYYNGPFAYLISTPKPVIAALNGVTAGLGLVLALYADIRFISTKASITTVFARRGLVAEHGASWLLSRLVGHGHAMDLLLSSRKVKADEALRIGLVNQIFDEKTLMDDVLAYAKIMVDTVSPRSMAVIKAQLWHSLVKDFNSDLAVAAKEISASLNSEDFKEGFAHFIEKRKPRFNNL